MDIVKPSILPGMMELLPAEQRQFDYIKQVICRHFELAGCAAIDTPILEKSEVLLAKGGGETEKQVYRFMKGDNDLSMRFDLTVPLARYVAQHMNDLVFPFRASHVGKVYRGERNQRGRYREFYQCDVDIIGYQTLDIAYDAQVPAIMIGIFRELNFGSFSVCMNNRKLLNGLFAHLGVTQPMLAMRSIDKMDKIGREAVEEELTALGMTKNSIASLLDFMQPDTNEAILARIENWPCDNDLYRQGFAELQRVWQLLSMMKLTDFAKIDLRIARGLDYYTGIVYETMLNDYPQLGSICSGGRYDNLASHYTKQALPGVGMSIGLTRLFFQLSDAGLLQRLEVPQNALTAMVMGLDESAEGYAIEVTAQLVEKMAVIHLPGMEKLGKRLAYADKLGVPYAVLVGSNEEQAKTISVKNLHTGEQITDTIEAVTALMCKH